MPFEPLQQEPIIQKRWAETQAFRAPRAAELNAGDRTFYMLVMLPYPSGRIHMGHVRNYTLGDVVARFRRMRGDKVMNPLGWDSFGLPAENAAIKNGIHPAIWTRDNIQEMKGQIKKMGISYDWDREIASYLPEYYKWNQWFFIKMWERGDVFRAMRNVNWCEALGTVLANEQVVDGKDERTGHPVVQKPMEQYFFAITRYAEELLKDMDQIDWPENVKTMQRHWIGKSTGARLTFALADGQEVSVFTTRLDTLFGVTFMALSTEHPFIQKAAESDPGLKAFCAQVAAQSREERLTSDVKLGHKSRLEAVHPFTGEKVPIFAANYVLMDYGTGAVMGVPAHDERDFEFAQKYGIPIPKVIESENPWEPGILVNSGEFTGLSSEAAADAMVEKLGGRAAKAITYKLKDWGLSRARPRLRRGAGEGGEPAGAPAGGRGIPGQGGLAPHHLQVVPGLRLPQVRRARPARDRHHGHLRGLQLVLDALPGPPERPAALRQGRGRRLGPGGPLRGRHRARGHAPDVRPLFLQGHARPGPAAG